jgi:hypothetical protein
VTVAVVVLALVLASSLGLNGWLTYRTISGAEQRADARVAQVETEAIGERTAYELEVTQKALAAANLRAATLEEELAHAFEQSDLGAGLAASDARGRVLRLVGKWGEAARTRSPLPAEPDDAVPDEPAADASGPVLRPER